MILPEPQRFKLVQRELVRKDICELSPVIWQGRLCHLACVRPATGGSIEDYYLELTGEVLTCFAQGYGLASAYIQDGIFYAFASRYENNKWNDVTLFKSSGIKNWEEKLVIQQDNENLFNTSVCKGPDCFVMAYETNDPKYLPFTIKFAVSNDLENWSKLPNAIFGTNRYTACKDITMFYILNIAHCVIIMELDQKTL